jgi:hypothetical protein
MIGLVATAPDFLAPAVSGGTPTELAPFRELAGLAAVALRPAPASFVPPSTAAFPPVPDPGPTHPPDPAPATCATATNYDEASKCPDSVSAHPFRRAAITYHLNNDVPKPMVSDRMDVSPDVIDEHYDAEDERGKMNRRREYVEDI